MEARQVRGSLGNPEIEHRCVSNRTEVRDRYLVNHFQSLAFFCLNLYLTTPSGRVSHEQRPRSVSASLGERLARESSDRPPKDPQWRSAPGTPSVPEDHSNARRGPWPKRSTSVQSVSTAAEAWHGAPRPRCRSIRLPIPSSSRPSTPTRRRVAPGGPAGRKAQQRGTLERSRHRRRHDVLVGAWNGDVTGSHVSKARGWSVPERRWAYP